MTITSLRTPLRTTTLAAGEGSVTATKTSEASPTQPTTPTLSERQLRTMLSASRASGDPVAIAGAGATSPTMQSTPLTPIVLGPDLRRLFGESVASAIDWQRAAEKWKASLKP